MSSRRASCHCHGVRLTCVGDPRKVSMCCCVDCQRRTGSAFSVAVFFSNEQVTVDGKTQTYARPSASGFAVTFHFCPACGSNLFWRPQRMPDRIGIAIGAFADPDFPGPQQVVWTKDRQTWLDLPAHLPCFAQNPPPQPS
ncbi:MAG TPA: GFA family protein [Caulobacter sp.]|nr:GFA family protein [Caulobacter sp.]